MPGMSKYPVFFVFDGQTVMNFKAKCLLLPPLNMTGHFCSTFDIAISLRKREPSSGSTLMFFNNQHT